MGDDAILRKLFDDFLTAKDVPKIVREFIISYQQIGDIYREVWLRGYDKEFVKQLLQGLSARKSMWAAQKVCEGIVMGVVVQSGLTTERQLKKRINRHSKREFPITLSAPRFKRARRRSSGKQAMAQSDTAVADCDERSVHLACLPRNLQFISALAANARDKPAILVQPSPFRYLNGGYGAAPMSHGQKDDLPFKPREKLYKIQDQSVQICMWQMFVQANGEKEIFDTAFNHFFYAINRNNVQITTAPEVEIQRPSPNQLICVSSLLTHKSWKLSTFDTPTSLSATATLRSFISLQKFISQIMKLLFTMKTRPKKFISAFIKPNVLPAIASTDKANLTLTSPKVSKIQSVDFDTVEKQAAAAYQNAAHLSNECNKSQESLNATQKTKAEKMETKQGKRKGICSRLRRFIRRVFLCGEKKTEMDCSNEEE